MVEATAGTSTEFTSLESCHSNRGEVFFDGDGCLGNCKFRDLSCSKDFPSGVSSFLEKLITHLSWILEELKEVTTVLKVLDVLKAILGVVVEALEMSCLSFLIWDFLYCRNVFSLLLKMVFCTFLKVGSSSFCCRDILGFSYFSLEVVDLDIHTLHSIVDKWMFSFLYYDLFKCIAFPFDLQGFWCHFIY